MEIAKTETVTTAKGTFLFIEIPGFCSIFYVNMGYLIFNSPDYENYVTDKELSNPFLLSKYLKRVNGKSDIKKAAIKLPDGEFKIIGVTSSFVTDQHGASQNIDEERAKLIVGYNGMGCYDNYRGKVDEKYTCLSAHDSFRCLMQSLDLKKEAYAILQKI